LLLLFGLGLASAQRSSQKNQCVQTSSRLSAHLPRMLQLKRNLKSAEAAVKRLRRRLNALEEQHESCKNRIYLQPLAEGVISVVISVT